jgi:hypothetical protein
MGVYTKNLLMLSVGILFWVQQPSDPSKIEVGEML